LLAEEMREGDLIWTRAKGTYYLARVLGPWRYESRRENQDADIVNVRPVQLLKVGTEADVPGKVVADFRAAQTLRRIRDTTVANFSKHLFNKKTGTRTYSIDVAPNCDVFSLLSDGDCEDVIYVYLQARGYIVFPSRRRRDLQAYEYVLVHKKTKREAIAQVKTGNAAIPVDAASWQQPVSEVYVFNPNECYLGKPGRKVVALRRRTIKRFMERHKDWLPPAVKTWMEIAQESELQPLI
jgi:hypothetical protein